MRPNPLIPTFIAICLLLSILSQDPGLALAGYLVQSAVGAGRAVAALALADTAGSGILATSALIKMHHGVGELGGVVAQGIVLAHNVGFHELYVGEAGG